MTRTLVVICIKTAASFTLRQICTFSSLVQAWTLSKLTSHAAGLISQTGNISTCWSPHHLSDLSHGRSWLTSDSIGHTGQSSHHLTSIVSISQTSTIEQERHYLDYVMEKRKDEEGEMLKNIEEESWRISNIEEESWRILREKMEEWRILRNK